MKKSLLFVLFFNLLRLGYAQTEPYDYGNDFSFPEIIRPSPSVAELMKVEEATISHYTGQPEIAIPIFQKSLMGFDYGLNLRYNVSGIRNTEQSGWVGTGWSLEAGGVISRTVVGLPDDIDWGAPSSINPARGFHNGGFETLGSDLTELTFDAQYTSKKLDYQRDIYQFNFFGKTGRFYIDYYSGPQIIGENKEQLEIGIWGRRSTAHFRNSVSLFIIKDAKGYEYWFSAIEKTSKNETLLGMKHNGASLHRMIQSYYFPDYLQFNSAWQLTSVRSPHGKKVMGLSYTDVIEKPKAPSNKSSSRIINSHLAPEPACLGSLRAKSLEVFTNKTITSKKLASINFADGVSLVFTPSTDSHPEYQGKYLDRINVNYNDSTVKFFDFNYSHNLKAKNLLFLNNIVLGGKHNQAGESYGFSYYKTDLLFPFVEWDDVNNNAQKLDDFGYYKDTNVNNYSTNVAVGALSKIEYPTKGARELAWSANSYSYEGSRLLSFEEVFENPKNYTIAPSNSAHIADNYNPSTPTFINPNIDHSATLHYTINQTTWGENYYIYVIPVHSNGNLDNSRDEIGSIKLDSNYNSKKINLQQGLYKIYVEKLTPNLGTDAIDVTIEIHLKNITTGPLHWYVNGGGVRISSISDKDLVDNSLVTVKRVKYDYGFEQDPAAPLDVPDRTYCIGCDDEIVFSSGSLDGFSNKLRKYNYYETPFLNAPSTVALEVTEVLNDLDVQLAQGSFIGYQHVFEYGLKPGLFNQTPENGYTSYTFHNSIDYPSYPNNYNHPFPPVPDISYKKGNLKLKKVYDAQGKLLQRIGNKYNYEVSDIAETIQDVSYISLDNPYKLYSGIFDSYDTYMAFFDNNTYKHVFDQCGGAVMITNIPINYFEGKDEYRYTKHLISSETEQYFYNDGGALQDVVTKREDYEYNPFNYQVNKKDVYFEEGGGEEHLSTVYRYPSIVSTDSYAVDLYDQHRLNEVVSVRSYKNDTLIAVRKNIYDYLDCTNGPVTQSSGSNPLPLYLSKVRSGKYNTVNSNVTSVLIENGLEDRLIYDCYDEYGNPLEVHKAGGVPISYIWGYNKSYPVAKVENATYAEIEGVLGSGFDLGDTGLSGSQENSLRSSLELSDAMITVYEYEPLVGMTKQADPRGYTTYYEYDQQNRLKYIKDDNGDVVKSFEYNYRPFILN